MKTAAVLGAGLQGVCAALAARRRGYRVLLLDQEPEPMLRASLRNEGKMHLGFVYANDDSFRTARLMLESALRFAPLLDEWLPGVFGWGRLRSRPFTYLVMRDSLVDADTLCAHCERVADAWRNDGLSGAHYLGRPLSWTWRRAPLPAAVDPGEVAAAVATEETALDLDAFRAALWAGLRALPEIEPVYGLRIEGVSRNGHGFRIEGQDGDGGRVLAADVVVNCLWEGRLAIDRQLGLEPSRPWVHRLRYRLVGQLPERLRELPPLTLVLGPYGAVVPVGSATYLSWYPACRRGWSDELEAPPEWGAACGGRVPAALAEQIARESLQELDRIVPGIAASTVTQVDAGVVFAWGDSDIDEPGSEFHQRHAVGVHEHDGYYSIDTGKLTCAPYFADQLARRL